MAKIRKKQDVLNYLQSKYGLNNQDYNELSSSDLKDRFNGDLDKEEDEDLYEGADEWVAFSELDEHIDIDETDDEHLTVEFLDQYGYISERIKKTRVIRNGKKVIKWKTERPGYKIQNDGGRVREIKMSPIERIKRSKQQRIGARKRKRTSRVSQIKRKRSIKRRTF